MCICCMSDIYLTWLVGLTRSARRAWSYEYLKEIIGLHNPVLELWSFGGVDSTVLYVGSCVMWSR